MYAIGKNFFKNYFAYTRKLLSEDKIGEPLGGYQNLVFRSLVYVNYLYLFYV